MVEYNRERRKLNFLGLLNKSLIMAGASGWSECVFSAHGS